MWSVRRACDSSIAVSHPFCRSCFAEADPDTDAGPVLEAGRKGELADLRGLGWPTVPCPTVVMPGWGGGGGRSPREFSQHLCHLRGRGSEVQLPGTPAPPPPPGECRGKTEVKEEEEGQPFGWDSEGDDDVVEVV